MLCVLAACVALTKNNLRRLLLTVEALSDLGPQMTSERDFTHIARSALAAVLEALLREA